MYPLLPTTIEKSCSTSPNVLYIKPALEVPCSSQAILPSLAVIFIAEIIGYFGVFLKGIDVIKDVCIDLLLPGWKIFPSNSILFPWLCNVIEYRGKPTGVDKPSFLLLR